MNKVFEKKIKCYFMLIDGTNPAQIVKQIGCGNSSPKNWFPRLCKTNSEKKELSKRQKNKIIELKKLFLSHKEIALAISATENQVKCYCQRNGIGYSQEELKEFKRKQNAIPELEIECRILNRSKGKFKYYGNYERSGEEYKCDIQCVKCGDIKTINSVTIRQWKRHGTHCIECQKAENQRKAEQEKHIRQEKSEKKKLALQICKILNKRIKELSRPVYKRQCPKCMQSFETMNERKVYCSDKCARAIHDNIKDDRFKKFGVKQNYKITLKAIYERDQGICQICEKPCDWNDFYINENGVFIAGNMYPSKDHIKALANGGLDTWENNQLAHRICNTNKSDST